MLQQCDPYCTRVAAVNEAPGSSCNRVFLHSLKRPLYSLPFLLFVLRPPGRTVESTAEERWGEWARGRKKVNKTVRSDSNGGWLPGALCSCCCCPLPVGFLLSCSFHFNGCNLRFVSVRASKRNAIEAQIKGAKESEEKTHHTERNNFHILSTPGGDKTSNSSRSSCPFVHHDTLKKTNGEGYFVFLSQTVAALSRVPTGSFRSDR